MIVSIALTHLGGGALGSGVSSRALTMKIRNRTPMVASMAFLMSDERAPEPAWAPKKTNARSEIAARIAASAEREGDGGLQWFRASQERYTNNGSQGAYRGTGAHRDELAEQLSHGPRPSSRQALVTPTYLAAPSSPK